MVAGFCTVKSRKGDTENPEKSRSKFKKTKIMKKVSISLFAILAIALAVTSAFTTAPSKFTTTYKYWGVANDTYTSVPSVTQFEAGTLIYDAGTTNSTIAGAFSSTAADDGCDTDNTYYCAGEITNVDGSKTVTESAKGDFHAN